MFRGASSGAIHDPLRARCAERVRKMRAMQLAEPGEPLRLVVREIGKPDPGQLLLRVLACGVCRTDLHIVDGELPHPDRTVIPGHEIVGEVIERGARAERFGIGERVGVPWLGSTCGDCRYCRTGRENLCDGARFTGYHIDGGYAEFALADARYCFALPQGYAPEEAAPLLCAGLIGYRALSIAGDAQTLGIYGFGAAAHIVAQVARFRGRGGAALRARPRSGLGGRIGRRPARTARRGDPLRAGRRAGSGGPARREQRRYGSLRRNSYERDPGVSLRDPV